ncbi:MAG: DUF1738 domain-containing protein [Hyphomicrobiales bacterium]|nr:DUF1738 domain-containing protein [Hyphomicrobiales bacterium]MDE2115070.1 DUF1738 domain-containing protein [Hyphomicrobiales bacterium]
MTHSHIRPAAERASIYHDITQGILAQLEAGTVPWVQPWTSRGASSLGLPVNALSKRAYSGINILILWRSAATNGFTSNTWLTFRQALELGGNVRKGAHGTSVVFANRFTPEEERQRAAQTGETPGVIPFLKRFTLFNTEQCERLPDDCAVPAPQQNPELVAPQVEALIKATKMDFRVGGAHAFYNPLHDYVQVPRPEDYFEPINWHRTVLHEGSHWAGHPTRLNRFSIAPSNMEDRAKEELVAEISASYLCATLGIVPTVRHADYIASWLTLLKSDERAIVKAASAASKTAEFILSFREAATDADAANPADTEQRAA